MREVEKTNRKIIGIIIVMMLMTATGISVAGAMNVNKTNNELPSSSLNCFHNSIYIDPTDDSWVDKLNPTVNYGTDDILWAVYYGTPWIARSHLQFDVSSIPPNAIIDGAELGLWYWNWDDVGTPEIGVYKVLDPWDESTITWNNQPSFYTSYEDSVLLGPPTPPQYVLWDVTFLTQEWVDGSFTNNGIVVKCVTETGGASAMKMFRSKEWMYSYERPYLFVYYNIPPTPPGIAGQINGNAGTPYSYTFTSTDPEGDEVSYYIDWDDGTPPTWSAYYPSGSSHMDTHTWTDQGTYDLKAKAKDIHGAESVLNTLIVTMPRNKAFNSPFLMFLQNHPNMFPILQLLVQRIGLL